MKLNMDFLTALNVCNNSLDTVTIRKKTDTSSLSTRSTYLYCIVSDVVEALSLVIRILTMLKRKTKFI